MNKGQQSAYPCPRIDTPRSMTYRQHLIVQIAPVMLTNFFSNNNAWQDYDDLAKTLVMAVDAIIEAERETAE
ncbi:hypothetical protein EH138_17735 [Salmonella enterica subsp. enterica serovar Eastbourne]|uniref:Uncharacterized protein n=1 Tax=Salmonella enterica subsp. enterica serovar Eastbourne TaxID=486993 RepID=A0A702BCW7_SALET|nr:hypothetical protein [Salmonella enterica subsp. enterica serovar Eastbourne]EEC0687282.1 hypothetical protein [Salmonella enterica subsp. enterica serovar Bahrenfeld]ECA1897610.1 hypothetical protein [Salmonella enterica subsp. enterica serovar Eastbourne]HAC6678294.1 hypothetical protein [Salmonella enterica subsp. enterica serovar Eastbourne]HAE5115773.1 hypothetical protein [Salmonella enterica subsp. enterica serovar Eastbourne]